MSTSTNNICIRHVTYSTTYKKRPTSLITKYRFKDYDVFFIKVFYYQQMLSQVPNSAADIHQGPDNICSHTARLTTVMYFNQMF